MKFTGKCLSIILFLSVSVLCISFGGQKATWKGKIEIEDRVKVIKNPGEPLYGEITFELEEDLSIGKEEDENYLFYRPRDVVVDSQGNIYVADARNYRIQIFDKNGKYLRTIGRQGEGPGEFHVPSKVRVSESTGNIYVRDDIRTIEVFNKQGNHLRQIRLSGNLIEFWLNEDGSITAIIRNACEAGYMQALCKLNSKGEIVRKYIEFPYSLSTLKVGEMIAVTSTGYEFSLFLSKVDNHSFVYGYSKEYELDVIDKDGEILQRIRKDESRPKYTIEEKKKYDGSGIQLPELKPYFYSILNDSKGRIYIQKKRISISESSDIEFDVFSRDGHYLYKTFLPLNTYVIKNGFLYALILDEEGIELIKRFRIKNWKQIKERI